MERWHDGEKYQRIGDIIGKNAPYLKMYTEYVKNFDNAMGAINTWYNKNSKFANIMDSIHVSSVCKEFIVNRKDCLQRISFHWLDSLSASKEFQSVFLKAFLA